jgi:hypothetical protein
MNDPRTPPPSQTPASGDQSAASRPAYETPRVVKQRAISRVTLFSGGGGPSSVPPLVSNG